MRYEKYATIFYKVATIIRPASGLGLPSGSSRGAALRSAGSLGNFCLTARGPGAGGVPRRRLAAGITGAFRRMPRVPFRTNEKVPKVSSRGLPPKLPARATPGTRYTRQGELARRGKRRHSGGRLPAGATRPRSRPTGGWPRNGSPAPSGKDRITSDGTSGTVSEILRQAYPEQLYFSVRTERDSPSEVMTTVPLRSVR